MNPIIINEEKCIGCSLCVFDCPNACLRLAGGKARFDKPACIECGHCYAICPQGAIRMTNYESEDEPVVPMTAFDSDMLLSAMRSRRTIRHFTPQPVEEEKIQKIRSGKISADQLLERAQAFKNEPRGERPQRSPQEVRKAASLPVINSFASDMIRKNRQAERQRIREERAREKAKKKAALGGIGGAKPFPPLPITPEAFRELFPEDDESREDTEARLKIPKEKSSAASSRNGPSNDVRKKLREKRKKRR